MRFFLGFLARTLKRQQNETYLSAFSYPPQAHARLSRAHENPWRTCRDQCAPCQGPSSPGGISQGLSGGKGFSRRQRLLKAAEFEAVFSNRCASRSACFQVLARPNEQGHARLGMVVSRRLIPLAVERNRMRRLIREAFRHLADGLPSVDLVVRPQLPFSELPPNPQQRLDLADAINKAAEKCYRAC